MGLLFRRATVGSGNKDVSKSLDRSTKIRPESLHYEAVPSNVEMRSRIAATTKAMKWVLREEFINPGGDRVPPGKHLVVSF